MHFERSTSNSRNQSFLDEYCRKMLILFFFCALTHLRTSEQGNVCPLLRVSCSLLAYKWLTLENIA